MGCMRIYSVQDALFLKQPDEKLIAGHGNDGIVSREPFYQREHIIGQVRQCIYSP